MFLAQAGRKTRSTDVSRTEIAKVPVLHVVTNDDIVAHPDFIARASAVMEALGARGAVHLRSRAMAGAALHRIAEALASAQQAAESWLVVNDRLDVALAVGARGVQLTSASISVEDALPIASRGGISVGASTHSVSDALSAAKAGATWIVAGHVYATESHPGDPPRGTTFLEEVVWRVATPVIAIGGIRPETVGAMRKSGAHGVAVIRGIWSASDAARAATEYLIRYDADGDQ